MQVVFHGNKKINFESMNAHIRNGLSLLSKSYNGDVTLKPLKGHVIEMIFNISRYLNVVITLNWYSDGTTVVKVDNSERQAGPKVKEIYDKLVPYFAEKFGFELDKPHSYKTEFYGLHFENKGGHRPKSLISEYLKSVGISLEQDVPWHWTWEDVFAKFPKKISKYGLISFGLLHKAVKIYYHQNDDDELVVRDEWFLEDEVLYSLNYLVDSRLVDDHRQKFIEVFNRKMFEQMHQCVTNQRALENLDLDIDLTLSRSEEK